MNWRRILGAVLVSIPVLWFYLRSSEELNGPRIALPAPTAPATAPAPAAPPAVAPRAAFATTPGELLAMYHANELAADKRIGGAQIRMTGPVAAIEKDFAGDPRLKFREGDDFDEVLAIIDAHDTEAASTLHKGDSVTLSCGKSTLISGSVFLTECRLAHN